MSEAFQDFIIGWTVGTLLCWFTILGTPIVVRKRDSFARWISEKDQ